MSVASSGAIAIKMTLLSASGGSGRRGSLSEPTEVTLPKIKFADMKPSSGAVDSSKLRSIEENDDIIAGCDQDDLEEHQPFTVKIKQSRPILLMRRMSNTVMHTVNIEKVPIDPYKGQDQGQTLKL